MFGGKIRFNTNGEDQHKTCAGSLCSIFIFGWIGFLLYFLVEVLCIDDKTRLITTILYPNYFNNV